MVMNCGFYSYYKTKSEGDIYGRYILICTVFSKIKRDCLKAIHYQSVEYHKDSYIVARYSLITKVLTDGRTDRQV